MLQQVRLDLTPGHLRALSSSDPTRYPVLFDSASQGALAEHTILAVASGPAVWLDATRRQHARGLPIPVGTSFLATLEAWRHQHLAAQTTSGATAWHPGWAVFLGYELVAEIEPSLTLNKSPEDCLAFAIRTPAGLVFDHRTGECWGLAETGAEFLLADIEDHGAAALARLAGLPACDLSESVLQRDSLQEPAGEDFIAAVLAAQAHIAAGNIYQANLSHRWSGMLSDNVSATQLYERLRIANPAPFACRAQFAGLDILSSSPERLLKIANGEISTRPIAGTRPRHGATAAEDAEIRALVAHPKERAEHVMLIDLERNDLGRVCQAGSVEVSEFMQVESYTHVHHIVSNVRGILRPDATPIDALRAVFPGGTITGCPKIRCMKIIAELEAAGRGVYTGSIGWLGCNGSADFNILIRTLSVQGRRVSFRAGAGIVADSDPARELNETRAKARGMLRALGAAT